MTADSPGDPVEAPVFERVWTCALELASYAAIEGEIAAALTDCGVEGRAAFVAQLVVEETVRNLVQHAPGAGPHDRAVIRLTVRPHDVVVSVEDDQQPFDPLSAPALDPTAPLAERRPGGMGLHLTRELTDALTYEQLPGGNRLTARVLRT